MNVDPAQAPSAPTAPGPAMRIPVRLLGLAVAVGAVAALGATGYAELTHVVRHLLWQTVPGWWGAEQAPGWWAVVVLVGAGCAVAGAFRLPGHGGHHPLDGISFDIGPRALPSALLAALASLAAGAVLGPEAPLLAVGTAVALTAARGASDGDRAVLALCGAGAALGVVFGNPLVTGILLLESVLLAGMPGDRREVVTRRLLPVLTALGAGYVVEVGIDGWAGIEPHRLRIADLPTYPDVLTVDLLVGLAVAVVTSVVVVAATQGARTLRARADARPGLALPLGGAAVAGIALAASAVTGQDVDVILFSGQETLGDVLTVGTVGTLAVLALAKAAAYAVSLGVGFRGGAIFPAVAVGATVAAAGHLLVPQTSVAGLVAAGLAAGAASSTGLPFTSVLLAVMTLGAAGLAVTVPAILGAVVAVLVVVVVGDLTRRRTERQSLVTGE